MLNPNVEDIDFYHNEYKLFVQHLILTEIKLEGQKRLKKAKVLCVGVGGLGSACLLYLAAAGIDNIGIIDHDVVEQSNLQRQVLYQMTNIGDLKVDCAQMRIQTINPYCIIETYNDFLDLHNALLIMPKYDLIIDGTDNLQTKYVISNACTILNKPHIYGAVLGFLGQISVFNYQGGPTYQDLYPIENINNALMKCTDGGILGPLPGIIGVLQAIEVIKIVTGIGNVLSESIMVYDALSISFKKMRLRKNTTPIYTHKRYNNLLDTMYYSNTESVQLFDKEIDLSYVITDIIKIRNIINLSASKILLLDVRNPSEYYFSHVATSINIPLKQLKDKETLSFLRKKSETKQIYVYCSTESRSIVALSLLHQHKIMAYRLSGGINKLQKNLKYYYEIN